MLSSSMKRLSIFLFMLVCLTGMSAIAQPAMGPRQEDNDSWQVTVNTMDVQRRDRISRVAEDIQSRGAADRGVFTGMLSAAGMSLVSSAIDLTATEVIRLATYRKEQQKEWQRMIENECSYSDKISSVKGLNDFYAETSRYGALDPSGINFDGICVRGVRNGKEVLYLSCHIDTTRLGHLFQHSKFYLVLDTLCFHPYECHLPNLSANGIRTSAHMETERDNRFSYKEREGLTVGMELALSSSWINEAVMVQKDIELGRFNMSVRIPEGAEVYTYSRKRIEQNRELALKDTASLKMSAPLDTNYICISGDSFIVPRSYMPLSGEERMWGTGEYNINITVTEKCRFKQDEANNPKLKNWHKDYLQIRKMQKKGSVVGEYLQTVWKQNGNNIIKSTIKQTLNSGASSLGLKTGGSSGGGGSMGSGSMGGASAGSGSSAMASAPGNNQGNTPAISK